MATKEFLIFQVASNKDKSSMLPAIQCHGVEWCGLILAANKGKSHVLPAMRCHGVEWYSPIR